MSLSLTPKEIVAELDKHIVGQHDAKRAVSIALRNRWRRQQLEENLRFEVVPKNMLMVGPTGVGKTEIARRLARLAGAPFLKVEATKFTEVGYVGRDVEQIIRDLVEVALHLVREIRQKEMQDKAKSQAEERLVDILVGDEASSDTRAKFRTMLKQGMLDDRDVEIEVSEDASPRVPTFDIPGMPGAQMGMINLGEMMGKMMGSGRTKKRTVKVVDALPLLTEEALAALMDEDSLTAEAISLTENHGIVFLDEIDKICAQENVRGGDVSREGVQRDLLPLIEGTTVNTKYGMVKTDHILFIASGAFHLAKPSDLLPELQGRLPIRVELKPLTRDDFRRILTEPQASLIVQYKALLATEGVTLDFTDAGIDRLADLTSELNTTVENIGARRLHTILERVVEDISFTAPEQSGATVTIDAAYIDARLGALAKSTDLARFIL